MNEVKMNELKEDSVGRSNDLLSGDEAGFRGAEERSASAVEKDEDGDYENL